ncbi:chromosome segregation protein SMC [Aliiglaciecola sp. LCG003]|uniref:chromosome segregation protein SMC n=1 Tax=Aliiglaciecola sp. LCG003 TaxID=3053655 RepID=UPI0025733534|nr:chromosome segregation protein SMC [Aliiglaciecola sp. LCG003]WJG10899.1 chromosome segregation protein SMC [Aliiglaciecola sp. LCG003]
MRLKKIRLAGFKSFVDPTNIPFPDDMTAIVGPNGCGKSNVIDAVRWVLGESSAKNLRGDAMTDVIFNGSSARKPVSQCSVELVFDNTSGRIHGEFANYTELSVKRLVTREAQSSYFLNGTKCRRRDVTDIFLGTGLGPRSYAIIEQGTISRLIESKPQELRVFIEEAAGISKYKERRRETENRIRHTKENLERLEDVRGELGQQLEKLQRQATAARKYTELKRNERLLKGELAAMRWLSLTQHISELESSINQKENDIEGFIAKQRGEEKGITLYREQQLNLKQQLSDLQQDNFKVGTEITKLEQNRLHAKQRSMQIETELEELARTIKESTQFAQQEELNIADIAEQLAQAQPTHDTLAAQLEQAQEQLFDSQELLSRHQLTWQQQDRDYQLLKQQAQNCHSQIQSTMTMQMRTQQRINELLQEQNELEQDVLAEQIESLQHQVAQAKGRLNHAKQNTEEAQKHLDDLNIAKHTIEQKLFEAKGKLQQLEAKIAALESLQNVDYSYAELAELLQQHNTAYQPMWQKLRIQSGWETALEAVTANWQQALWLDGDIDLEKCTRLPSGKLILDLHLSAHKPEGSIAALIDNPKVPDWLGQILVADTLEQGLAMRETLNSTQSIVTFDGHFFSRQWIDLGSSDTQAGMIARAAQISQLVEQRSQSLNYIESELQEEHQGLQEQLEAASAKLNTVLADFKQAEQALTQQQNQLNLLEMQHQQTLIRQTRISEELSRQQQQLEDEKLQSEQLSEQVQELEIQIDDLALQLLDIERLKTQYTETVQQQRAQVEHFTAEGHKLALLIQDSKSQYIGIQQAHRRTQQLLDNMLARQSQLLKESDQVSQPAQEQQNTLTVLLQQRIELEKQQTVISDQLVEVESLLSAAEKGQQGVADKVQIMREELADKKVQCEGYRVRANSTLEQLRDLNQPLKQILETLPKETDESQWQADLERTSAAIGRLGAVNLAAVEEFDVQAQRKQHLDDQNDDLVAALDTLEGAIRKIDKETRNRFKQTFDKVNNGLQELFPKVFGGGSAYLELTGEDLLETGVTIMARPPGKKNSTIHLLSGGEKALTALSLVFAIFRLNPAPFCLLDEVDAPLDDANVGRFCKLVSEMSKSVQFIYITHNKIAMEMAKHLTGVTMAEPGVSRMVSVDVEEAVAIAQA